MSNAGVSPLGWVTSALLSLVTLFVFGSLRNYGPDSVIRQFHMAAVEHNAGSAAALVTPDLDSASSQELWMNVSAFLNQYGASYEIQNVYRQPSEEILVVQYKFPAGERRSLPWVVVRKGGVWKIDSNRTVLAARKLTSAPTYGLFPLR